MSSSSCTSESLPSFWIFLGADNFRYPEACLEALSGFSIWASIKIKPFVLSAEKFPLNPLSFWTVEGFTVRATEVMLKWRWDSGWGGGLILKAQTDKKVKKTSEEEIEREKTRILEDLTEKLLCLSMGHSLTHCLPGLSRFSLPLSASFVFLRVLCWVSSERWVRDGMRCFGRKSKTI